jgi:hypothetical protein
MAGRRISKKIVWGRAVYAFFTKVQLGGSAAKCGLMPPIPQAKAPAVRFKRVPSLGHA